MNETLNMLGGILAVAAYVAIIGVTLVFWISMLISAIKNDRLSRSSRIIWVLVIVLLELFGALIYYFVAHKQGAPKKRKN